MTSVYVDTRSPEQRKIDQEAPALRARLQAEHHFVEWLSGSYPVRAGYPPEVVKALCVDHEEWQKVRLSMKGQPTHRKLYILAVWANKMWESEPWATEVQIGNYLGALRRGGQLDAQNRVRKYL